MAADRCAFCSQPLPTYEVEAEAYRILPSEVVWVANERGDKCHAVLTEDAKRMQPYAHYDMYAVCGGQSMELIKAPESFLADRRRCRRCCHALGIPNGMGPYKEATNG